MRTSTSLVSTDATAPRPTAALRQLRALACGAVFDRMEEVLARALLRQERQLFSLTETARGMEQHAAFDGLRQLARTRASLLPELLRALDLAVQQASTATGACAAAPPSSAAWALLDPVDVAEDGLHASLAASLESTLHLPLYLLRERMSVVLQRPADLRTLPLGPFALLGALRCATRELDVAADVRLLALRAMAAELDVALPGAYLVANGLLRDGGVLPQLVAYRGPVRAAARTAPAVAPGANNVGAAGSDALAASKPTTAGAVASANATPALDTAMPHAEPDACMQTRRKGTRTSARDGAGSPAGPDAAMPRAQPGEAIASSTHWLDLASDGDSAGHAGSDRSLFDLMRHLVGSRRALLQKQPGVSAQPATHAVPHAQLDRLLRDLQRAGSIDAPVQPLRALVAAGLRAAARDGEVPGLCAEHADTVDLVDLLFEHLQRDVASRDNAAALFARLRVPMLRTALEDPAFFTRKQHPVRRLLDALADASGYWIDDSTTADDPLLQAMQAAVDQVAAGAVPGSEPFDTASELLQQRLADRARRAAIIERRHVDAEKGRERLDLARTRAVDAVTAAIGSRQLPVSIDALLRGPWTDALALAALREAEDGASFRERCAAAMLLVRRACGEECGSRDSPVRLDEAGGASSPSSARLAETGARMTEARATASAEGLVFTSAMGAAPTLAQMLEAGLLQVGTPASDVAACVAEHLSVADAAAAEIASTGGDVAAVSCEAPASSALTSQVDAMAMASQATSGQQRDAADVAMSMEPGTASGTGLARGARDDINSAPAPTQDALQASADLGSRSSAAQDASNHPDDPTRRHLDHLRRLPFGSWFDLQSSTGARRRCRMSWFSPVTGRCLFVNAHGQRLGDFTLQWLASEMAADRAALVREPQHSVLDGAWRSILGMLRALARPVAGASNGGAHDDACVDRPLAGTMPALV